MTGYIGTYGTSVKNGLSMKFDEVSDEMKQQKITFDIDYQDNKGQTKDAVTIYQKQIIKNPDVYMSGVTSQTMSIIDQVMSKKVPHFLWSFTPLFLDKYPNTYRTWANFGVEIDYYKNFIKSRKPKKVAILYVNIIGAKTQFEQHIIPWLKEQGISEENLLVEVYEIPKTNFKDLAAKVKNFSPDALLIEGFENNLTSIVKDFSSYNILDHKGNAMFSFDLLDAKDNINKDLLEGLLVTAPYFEYSQDKKILDWRKKFKDKYGKAPDYTDAFAYDLGEVLYQAARIMKQQNISFKKAVEGVQFDGLSGQVNFQKSGEMKYDLKLTKFKNGVLVPVE